MVSIFDTLRASKGLPANDPIAGIWGRKLAGGKNQKTEGTLPLTISANGENLIDYRIYGAVGGTGEQTESSEPAGYKLNTVVRSENSFDINTAIMGEYWINDDRNTFTYYADARCYFIPVSPNTTYTVTDFTDNIPSGSFVFRVAFTNAIPTEHSSNIGTTYRKQRINSAGGDKHSAMITNQNYNYLAIQVRAAGTNDIMLTESPTPPAEYTPYFRTDIPIYIGDTPLEQGEYVDYGEQKVYKYVDGVLTPTDPPVALPALPTLDGTTIIDFDNSPKPSKMYVKYRKN